MATDKDRKKVLTREYKETPKRMGVYTILNTRNNKQFIGISRDIVARLNRHRFTLKTNGEREIQQLQADWNQYGPEAFEFNILDELEIPDGADNYDPEEDLEALGRLWFDQLQPYEPDGYNKPL